MNINPVLADQCPSAETVKQRKISRDYDWSIDERLSIDDVLSVEKLYSVRIKNGGEFVACYYSGSRRLVRLDGAGMKNDCIINVKSGEWVAAENNEQLCKEADLNQCLYEIQCKKDNEKSF